MAQVSKLTPSQKQQLPLVLGETDDAARMIEVLESRPGQCPHCGDSAAKRGPSDEQEPVLMARNRSGAMADFILERADKAHAVTAQTPE